MKKTLRNGESFGEIALSYTNYRTASCFTSAETYLLFLSKSSFYEICNQTISLTNTLLRFFKETFPGLGNRYLADMICLIKKKAVPYGFKLIERGMVPSNCYIIWKGEAKVERCSYLDDCL